MRLSKTRAAGARVARDRRAPAQHDPGPRLRQLRQLAGRRREVLRVLQGPAHEDHGRGPLPLEQGEVGQLALGGAAGVADDGELLAPAAPGGALPDRALGRARHDPEERVGDVVDEDADQVGGGGGRRRPGRITYANEENGYTGARVDTGRGAGDLLTVVGALLGAQVGESSAWRAAGAPTPSTASSSHVENYTTLLPATVQGIRRYLGSGLVKGIGRASRPHHAALRAGHPDDHRGGAQAAHRGARGSGPSAPRKIADAWEEHKAIKEVMLFLQTVEVSTSIAVRIYKKYGDASISLVKNQPYRLAADVWGIGFLTADKIAQSVGIPHDSPERVKAGLQYALSQATDQGHCYLPEETADRRRGEAAPGGHRPGHRVPRRTGRRPGTAGDPGVVREKVPGPEGGDPVTAVYLVPFHRAELSLAAQLPRLLRTDEDRMPAFRDVAWDKALGWLKGRTGADLAPEQEAAVKLALTEKVAVLTGGPGCGKSFTVRSIVELARAKKAKVVLAAPTGRAAKRLAELTGAEASTVHRLLELKPGGDAAYDRTARWTPTWWWSTRPPCWTCCSPTSWSRRWPRAPTCCSSGTSTSCPASVRGRCSGTCSPRAARSPPSASPACSARPSSPAWSPTRTGSTPGSTPSPTA
ncbi:ATP-dependent RecD-like DNA helicase [Streptomyces tanashiensis]